MIKWTDLALEFELPVDNHTFLSEQYPGDDGLVAPGMYCEFTVRFLPDTLADYEEVLHVATEQGVMSIPLLARRSTPHPPNSAFLMSEVPL